MVDLTANIEVTEDMVKAAMREKLTEATGPENATMATVNDITPFDEIWQDLSDIIRESPNIPDDALIQRIVTDTKNGYTKVWYVQE